MSFGYDDIVIFLAIARHGSFSAAARALNMPTSTVSRRVAALENRLNTQLLRRTTRTIGLTDDGRAFAARCGEAIESIDAASQSLSRDGKGLTGRLRVSAPFFACSELFGPYLLEFAAAHRDLVMDLRLTNGTPDLLEDDIDLAFQFGPLRDSRLIARKLWPVRYVLCVSAKLAPSADALRHPDQLADLPCVVTPPLDHWLFERGGEKANITPQTRGATIEDLALGAVAVRRGLGFGYLPESLVIDASSNGLVTVDLNGWQPVARDLFAVYPATRQLSSKVRAAVEHAVAGRDWYKRSSGMNRGV
ncbi:LysR family transcriptional regulator [Rhizobium lusitanum]|nr:LysR family transcriptional regulator [Rhizobium lusitanum]